jgi:hypothetical protein
MGDNLFAHFLVGLFKSPPNCSLTTTRGPHNHNTHTLIRCLLELENLLDLIINVLELVLLNCFVDCFSELLLDNVL